MNSKPKVLVACPMSFKLVDDQEWFTGNYWLRSILLQDYDQFRIFVLAHNLTTGMIDLLIKILMGMIPKADVEYVMREYSDDTMPDERGNRESISPGKKIFATLRNKILDYALDPVNRESERVSEMSFDYLVSLDSDVTVHPEFITRLVEVMELRPDVGMCAAPVNNTRRPDMDLHYPNAIFNFGWLKEPADTFTDADYYQAGKRDTGKFKLDSLIPVDYAGAACIIRLGALRDHPEIKYAPFRLGEDHHFCFRMKRVAGKEIVVDTSLNTLHMMHPELWKDDIEAFEKRKVV